MTLAWKLGEKKTKRMAGIGGQLWPQQSSDHLEEMALNRDPGTRGCGDEGLTCRMRPSAVPMWATVTLSRRVTYSAVTSTGPNSPLNRSTRKRLLLTSRGKWRQLILGLETPRPG